MTPLFVFAICIAAAIAVGYLRSLEVAKPLVAPTLAKTRSPRISPKRAPARPSETRPTPVAGQPEAA